MKHKAFLHSESALTRELQTHHSKCLFYVVFVACCNMFENAHERPKSHIGQLCQWPSQHFNRGPHEPNARFYNNDIS
jgi:hypothetical protein